MGKRLSRRNMDDGLYQLNQAFKITQPAPLDNQVSASRSPEQQNILENMQKHLLEGDQKKALGIINQAIHQKGLSFDVNEIKQHWLDSPCASLKNLTAFQAFLHKNGAQITQEDEGQLVDNFINDILTEIATRQDTQQKLEQYLDKLNKNDKQRSPLYRLSRDIENGNELESAPLSSEEQAIQILNRYLQSGIYSNPASNQKTNKIAEQCFEQFGYNTHVITQYLGALICQQELSNEQLCRKAGILSNKAGQAVNWDVFLTNAQDLVSSLNTPRPAPTQTCSPHLL